MSLCARLLQHLTHSFLKAACLSVDLVLVRIVNRLRLIHLLCVCLPLLCSSLVTSHANFWIASLSRSSSSLHLTIALCTISPKSGGCKRQRAFRGSLPQGGSSSRQQQAATGSNESRLVNQFHSSDLALSSKGSTLVPLSTLIGLCPSCPCCCCLILCSAQTSHLTSSLYLSSSLPSPVLFLSILA